MLIEMTRVQTAADFPTKNATCVDRGQTIQPVVSFSTGDAGWTMFVPPACRQRSNRALHRPWPPDAQGYEGRLQPRRRLRLFERALTMAHRDKKPDGRFGPSRFLDDRRGVSPSRVRHHRPGPASASSRRHHDLRAGARVAHDRARHLHRVRPDLARHGGDALRALHPARPVSRHHPPPGRRRALSRHQPEKGRGQEEGESLFEIDWSWAAAAAGAANGRGLDRGTLPLVAVGDSALLVETSLTSKPLFSYLGLSPQTFTFVSANRPRFGRPAADRRWHDPGSSGGEEDEDDE